MSKTQPWFEITKGMRVRKKGGPFEGTVRRWYEDWITVDWDEGQAPKVRPLVCHRYELEKAQNA